MELLSFLKSASTNGFLSLHDHFQAMELFTCNFREVEQMALENNITPLRYKRNQKTISQNEQHTLFQSTVLILGCGGLGGFVAEMLCRIGIGHLILMDGDVFEEHNLNRQNFSTIKVLGLHKAEVLRNALEDINPALHVKSIPEFFTLEKHQSTLEKVSVVVDALDNPTLKCTIAALCKDKGIPFVHGAIAGYYAQFATCNTLENLYKQEGDGAEKTSGNPSFTVCFAASIQSTEVIKLLLNKPHLENGLMADLWEYEFNLL